MASVLFVSCGEEPQSAALENDSKSEISKEEPNNAGGCIYNMDKKATKISWKAFKTSDRVAVGGIFPTFEVECIENGSSFIEVLESVNFSIPVSKMETGDKERDQTLLNYFFNSFVPEGNIYGTVDKVEGGESEGIISFILKMNGGKVPVDMKYLVKENVLYVNGTVDLHEFHGQDAMSSLNEQCGELHKGKDGVSKLWPEIEVGIVSKFGVKCD